jgi:hypothetical protein
MGNFPEIEYRPVLVKEEVEIGDGNSLDFLRACYRNPSLPLSIRLRAASIAISFELPKLAVTAVLNNQEDFATRLDRCIARAKEMRMLPGPVVEHSPSELRPTNGFKRRF